MKSKMVKNVYFPLTQWIKGERVEVYFKQLKRNETANREAIGRMQKELLALTLKTAADTPYYKRLFEQTGFEAGDISQFSKLPVTEKETVLRQTGDFQPHRFRGKAIYGRTSGSTGLALTIRYDREWDQCNQAAQLRGRSWWGLFPGCRELDIWGRAFDSSRPEWWERMKLSMMNRKMLSCFKLSDRELDKIVLELIRFNPELIYAYSTGAGRLAEYLIERYGESNPLKPRVVIITCETLFPHHKEAIKAAFRLEGANEYGAAEGGIIAFQCPEGGLHISVDRVMVEIAEPDEKGFGRVVITPLNNQAMVLLRYDLGDRGRLLEGVCACGRTLPLMELAGARVSEMIITSKGAIASSTFFDYMGKSLQPYGLRKFRVIQQSRIHFQIQLAGIESENIALEKRIKKAVQDFLGDDINVAIDYVSEINRDGSGKLRYFIREDFE